MQIEPYIIISDCHNLFFHTCPFRKIICFRQILYIFCEIVFSFVRKFYYHLPHQFCKSLSGAKQGVKTQLKYVFFLSSMLTNAHFKPFFRLLEIPNTENRHLFNLTLGTHYKETLLYRKNFTPLPHFQKGDKGVNALFHLSFRCIDSHNFFFIFFVIYSNPKISDPKSYPMVTYRI